MANSTSHVLPYPIQNARYTLELAFRTSAGTPTDPTTPDTEFSTDGGATFSDCAEEITTGGANGMGYLTLTGAETNNNVLAIAAKSANCLTTPAILYPRVLASVGTGTLSAGSAGGGTLGTLLAYDVTGCFIRTTGGTGGGGTGGVNNQARKIVTYNVSTGAFTVSPNWETTPDATTTYDVLLPESVTLGMLQALNPTTAGRKLDVSAGGEAGIDWANIGSPTTVQGFTNTTIGIVTAASLNMSQAEPVSPMDGTVGSAISAINNGVDVASVQANAITSGSIDSTAAVEIAGAVWDEPRSSHTTAGTFGAGVITTYAIKKNTAFTAFDFVMTDSTGHAPATGKTITATRSIDGGAFGACTNSAVEISDGAYKINFSAADLNGNNILFKFAATGCDDRFIQIVTQAG